MRFLSYQVLMLLLSIPRVAPKRSVAFECTARQEAEDLAAISTKEYRYSQAMVRLAICALYDGSSEKLSEAVVWLEQAAALGNAEAKNNLGVLRARGHGVQLDLEIAHALYIDAAGEGCSDAMHNLGVEYDTGRGAVAKDPVAAAHWFSQVPILVFFLKQRCKLCAAYHAHHRYRLPTRTTTRRCTRSL